MAGTLDPIPQSPTTPTAAHAAHAAHAAQGSPAHGPRPEGGEQALPIPAQLRALLQTRLSVTLADGRILLGTLTSVDSTSLLLSSVEELRDLSALGPGRARNVADFYPQSRDGVHLDADAGSGAGGEQGDGVEGGEGVVGERGEGGQGRIRRRELQSILVQFEHCAAVTMDRADWAAWRAYCELPPELHPTSPPARTGPLSLGQVI